MPHFIHSLVNRLFPLRTTMNNAAISINIQKFFFFFFNGHTFLFLEYIPTSEIAGSYGNSISNLLRNC